ncbi:MAG: hypothetical protein HY300_10535 [Verrucomicrobia bacterium]|nr:hypothetical protein [Verrucomicrobiota bacterium]
MRLLLAHDDQVEFVAKHLKLDWLAHAGARLIVSRRLDAHAQRTWQGAAHLLTEIEDDMARSLAAEVFASTREFLNPGQQLTDILVRLRNQAYDRELSSLMQRLGQPGLAASEQEALLRRQQELRQAKRRPLEAT